MSENVKIVAEALSGNTKNKSSSFSIAFSNILCIAQ